MADKRNGIRDAESSMVKKDNYAGVQRMVSLAQKSNYSSCSVGT